MLKSNAKDCTICRRFSDLSRSCACVFVYVCDRNNLHPKKVFMFHDLPVRMVPEDGSSTTLTALFQIGFISTADIYRT
uniref:Uncharacterized protein n=1 Tax=Anopheles funestus TaxID=62324 RepID=A0A182S179_ANOFN